MDDHRETTHFGVGHDETFSVAKTELDNLAVAIAFFTTV